MPDLPFYKRFPGAFLKGIAHMSTEQIAVYTVVLELMYDAWAPVEDRTAKQRRDLARSCGLSVRKFGTTLDELLERGKLKRTESGRISNNRFEEIAKDLGLISAATLQKSGENPDDNRGDNRGDKSGGSNDPKGLQAKNGVVHARATLESRTKNPEQYSDVTDLTPASQEVVEAEIQQICRAIGVTLTESTTRHHWPHRWVTMRTEHDLTVDDMIAAIESYSGQFKGESVKSLGMYQARAIEKRVARTLNDRLARTRAGVRAHNVEQLTDRQWFEHLKLFLALGTWPSAKLGPSPLADGCLAPIELLDKARDKWIQQGNHPEAMHHGGARVPWEAGKTGEFTVRTPTPFAKRAS